MKKLLYLIGIFVFLAAGLASPAAAGAPAAPHYDNPPPPERSAAEASLFLPVIGGPLGSYTVSGQVKDADDTPLSGVSVTSDSGEAALTDANGVYSLEIPQGQRQIEASLAGKNFDPAPAWISLNQDVHNLNFSAGAACTTPTANPSFEAVYYWNPISGSANGYTPYYSNNRANTGFWSGRTGIPVGWANRESWSRWRSHEIWIPATATTASVSLSFYPLSQETALARQSQALELAGVNMDDPRSPDSLDGQYLIVTDAANNWLATLMFARLNDQAWIHTGDLSLLAWKGRTIKLEFGTYNNGYDGVTSAYFDDVVASVCTGSSGCTTSTNLLVNSNFEAAPPTGWNISSAAHPSEYTTSFFYSASHSMLSGNALGAAYTPGWTTSEFYQYVTIPADATSAVLRVRLLPRSSDPWGYHLDQQAKLEAALAQAKPEAPLMEESQYGYLCYSGECAPPDAQTFYTLFRWFPIDSAYWLYRQFDLTALRGESFGIVFGAQDWGDGWNTALYVDDVSLEVCTP